MNLWCLALQWLPLANAIRSQAWNGTGLHGGQNSTSTAPGAHGLTNEGGKSTDGTSSWRTTISRSSMSTPSATQPISDFHTSIPRSSTTFISTDESSTNIPAHSSSSRAGSIKRTTEYTNGTSTIFVPTTSEHTPVQTSQLPSETWRLSNSTLTMIQGSTTFRKQIMAPRITPTSPWFGNATAPMGLSSIPSTTLIPHGTFRGGDGLHTSRLYNSTATTVLATSIETVSGHRGFLRSSGMTSPWFRNASVSVMSNPATRFPSGRTSIWKDVRVTSAWYLTSAAAIRAGPSDTATRKPWLFRSTAETSALFANVTQTKAILVSQGTATRKPWVFGGTGIRSAWYYNSTITTNPTASAVAPGTTWYHPTGSTSGARLRPVACMFCAPQLSKAIPPRPEQAAVTAGASSPRAEPLTNVMVTPAPVFGALPVGDTVAQAGNHGDVEIAGKILRPGGPGTVIQGTHVSIPVDRDNVNRGGLMLGGVFHQFPQITPSPVQGVDAGGLVWTPAGPNAIAAGSRTLTEGMAMSAEVKSSVIGGLEVNSQEAPRPGMESAPPPHDPAADPVIPVAVVSLGAGGVVVEGGTKSGTLTAMVKTSRDSLEMPSAAQTTAPLFLITEGPAAVLDAPIAPDAEFHTSSPSMIDGSSIKQDDSSQEHSGPQAPKTRSPPITHGPANPDPRMSPSGGSIDPEAGAQGTEQQVPPAQDNNSPSGGFPVGNGAAAAGSPPSASASGVIINGEFQSADSNGHITITGQTLSPGGPPATLSGTPISAVEGGLVLGTGNEATIAPFQRFPATKAAAAGSIAPPPSQPAIQQQGVVVKNEFHTLDKDGALHLDGRIIRPNGQPVTQSGSTLSLAPSGLVIASSGANGEMILTAAPFLPIVSAQATGALSGNSKDQGASELLLFGSKYTSNSNGAYIIASQTLSQGGTGITVSGTPVSIATNGLQVGTRFYPLITQYPSYTISDSPAPTTDTSPGIPFLSQLPPLLQPDHAPSTYTDSANPQIFTALDQTFTIPPHPQASFPSVIEIMGATITQNAPAQTISGQAISFGDASSPPPTGGGTAGNGIQVVAVGSRTTTFEGPMGTKGVDGDTSTTSTTMGVHPPPYGDDGTSRSSSSRAVGNPWESGGNGLRDGRGWWLTVMMMMNMTVLWCWL